jgi:hypothetical protein
MDRSIACVIPVYNGGATLRRALMAICTQQSLPNEVVILNNCSTDDTAEIAARYAEHYPFVRIVHYPEHRSDWREPACLNAICETKADYIHMLSCNDYVDSHFYLCVRAAHDAGFIFTEYTVQGPTPENKIVGFAVTESLPIDPTYPKWLLLEQLCKPKFFEGGPCCLIRRDAWQWLCDRQFWNLETYQDSIGYSVGAWLFGASYLPFACGYFTYDENSDGEKRKRQPPQMLGMYRKVCDFLDSVSDIPQRLHYALQAKVYCAIERPYRYLELVKADQPAIDGNGLIGPTPILASEAASTCASSSE